MAALWSFILERLPDRLCDEERSKDPEIGGAPVMFDIGNLAERIKIEFSSAAERGKELLGRQLPDSEQRARGRGSLWLNTCGTNEDLQLLYQHQASEEGPWPP